MKDGKGDYLNKGACCNDTRKSDTVKGNIVEKQYVA